MGHLLRPEGAARRAGAAEGREAEVTIVQHEVTNAELSRSLVRIEVKLDSVTGDHERRLRSVERWMYMAMGLAGAGAVSGVGSLIAYAAGGGP